MRVLRHTVWAMMLVLGVTVIGGSQQPDARQAVALQPDDSPARPGSTGPTLYASADGRIYLSWVEAAGGNRHALRFAVRAGGKWSEPRTVAEGENILVNWADFPSVVPLTDGTLAAHWLVKNGPGGHGYDVYIARSSDGGRTWSKPVAPHRDGTKTEHGFASLFPLPGGRVGAVWLDGRNFKEDSPGGHGSAADEMTLRYATIDGKGHLSEEALLDPRVCDCCQTSATLTSDGAVVVYRDRSEKEVRDISVLRFHKGRWAAPQALSADGWEIQGCPVNGPSVSADGRNVAVAWFTAAQETPRVNVAFSADASVTFGRPVRVDEGTPVGRVDVAVMSDGSALVSWLERTAKGADVRVRRVSPDGSRGQAITVAESGVARVTGFPQMARAGSEVIFAWTDPGTPPRVLIKAGRLTAMK